MPLKTIAEKGGLKVHLPEQGIDYLVFKQQAQAKMPAAAIARYWHNVLDKPVNSRTVSRWLKIYRQEER